MKLFTFPVKVMIRYGMVTNSIYGSVILKKITNAVCTVNLCSLIQLFRNVLQNTSYLHHGIRNSNPQIDHDHGNSRPCSICEEWQGFVYDSHIHEQGIYCTRWLKHGFHDQKGNELWNCDGKDKTKSPEAFKSCSLSVDKKGKKLPSM